MSKSTRPTKSSPVQIPSALPLGATQAQFDQAVKMVGEMVIPECPRAQAVARALTGLILVCRQYLQ
jgi:hypothetical protein